MKPKTSQNQPEATKHYIVGNIIILVGVLLLISIMPSLFKYERGIADCHDQYTQLIMNLSCHDLTCIQSEGLLCGMDDTAYEWLVVIHNESRIQDTDRAGHGPQE